MSHCFSYVTTATRWLPQMSGYPSSRVTTETRTTRYLQHVPEHNCFSPLHCANPVSSTLHLCPWPVHLWWRVLCDLEGAVRRCPSLPRRLWWGGLWCVSFSNPNPLVHPLMSLAAGCLCVAVLFFLICSCLPWQPATVHTEWFHGMIDLVLIPKYLTFVQMYNLLLIIDNSIQKVKLKVEFYND